MLGINKRTGSPIAGALENLAGRTPISFEAGTDENGLPSWMAIGDTEVIEKRTRARTTPEGQRVFIDENGNEVPHADVELVTAYSDAEDGRLSCVSCNSRDHHHMRRDRRPVGMSEAAGHRCTTCGTDTGTPTG